MYIIYASKRKVPDYTALVPYESHGRDESAKKCIVLFREGYTIHKVVLPTGAEIPGHLVESALERGWYSLRAVNG